MSLVQAIKFRFLISQLTKTELYQLVNKLLDQNTNIIASALFYAMIHKQNTQINVNEINNTISKIIQSRNTKPKPIPKQNMKMDQIPKQLIGVIASFLYQYDYINFSKTNRCINIGCNSPNLLQKLDISKKNVSLINLALYPSVKSLSFDVTKVKELRGLSRLNQLTFIRLETNKSKNHHFEALINSNINTNNVVKLKCKNAHHSNSRTVFTPYQLGQLLRKFPNIQYLSLMAEIKNVDLNAVKGLCPNLKGFAAYCTHQTNIVLINSFANNLEFLSLPSRRENSNYDLDKLTFSKLEQLVLFRPTVKSINDILNTAKSLKKVVIVPSVRHKCIMKADETEKIMTRFIMSCKSLEYIEIHDDGTLIDAALNGIENGLSQTMTLNRKKMKIRIQLAKRTVSTSFVLAVHVTKIIHCLVSADIDEFMFIMNGCGEGKIMVLQDLKDNISSHVEVKVDKHDVFVITNKNCKINGYLEKLKLKLMFKQ